MNAGFKSQKTKENKIKQIKTAVCFVLKLQSREVAELGLEPACFVLNPFFPGDFFRVMTGLQRKS